MKSYRLTWGPTACEIATVQARTARAAIRKAPAPWRKYLGEIRAEEVYITKKDDVDPVSKLAASGGMGLVD